MAVTSANTLTDSVQCCAPDVRTHPRRAEACLTLGQAAVQIRSVDPAFVSQTEAKHSVKEQEQAQEVAGDV